MIQDNKFKIFFYLNNCIVYIMKYLNKLHLYIINKFNIKKWHFKYMLPEEEAENIFCYEKMLVEALSNKKVKNIAVTGSYGVGKSSFLKTFEKRHPEYNFLDISLATFDEKEKDISIVEKSILEQLFYRESIDKIPQSRFKKIKSYKIIKVFFKAFLGILFFLAILFLFKPDFFTKLYLYNLIKNSEYFNYIEYISIFIFFVGFFIGLVYFIKNFSGLTLNRFNLQNIEIEAKKEDESSLLNKYLDEILYFFEKTNYQVVLFQDLDRFENSDIFIRLRELNNFLNNSKQVNKRIVFIYVLKDEMFEDKNERVKFFDVIIPIIPYVNYKTSYDFLIDWFKDVDKNFLKSVSLYIQDMRLLKNLYNEYKIFKFQIGKNLDKTKLLAIVIYKNFYPKDYNNLHQGKSIINEIINGKFEYIEEIKNKKLQEIEQLKEKIERLKKDLKNNIDVKELRKIYIFEILKKLNINANYFYCDNNRINVLEVLDDKNFERIKNCNNIKREHYNNGVSFREIEQKVNLNLSYKEREDLILLGTNEKIENLKKEIEKSEREIENLNILSLKDVLKNINLDKELEKYELKDKDLLKYLLLNGYMDEDYYFYTSYEMKNSLTPNDIQFLKYVKNDISLDFNFKLNNIEEIIDNLVNQDFNKESILNIHLVTFMIENKEKYKEQVKVLFKFLTTKNEQIEKFIAYCIDWSSSRKDFIRLIVKYNINTWKIIKKFGTKQSLDSYCGWIFTYANIEDIEKLLGFREYFENKTYLQNLSSFEVNKLIKYIKDKKIKFSNLKESRNFEINKFILENNCYKININMINFIVFNKCASKKEIEYKLKTANYTTIKNLDDYCQETLFKYIQENINQYVENVFLKLDENIKESEKNVIELLNNKDIKEELKVKIIEKEEVVITDLSLIEDNEIWRTLLEYDKIKPTWQNVGIYFNKSKNIDNVLFGFLERNANELSKVIINDEFCEENKNFDADILEKILLNNDFCLKIYELLIKSNGYLYDDLNVEELDNKKVELLLKYNMFQLTNKNIQNLKKYNLHINLILKHLETFIENIEKFELEALDYIKLLEKDIGLNNKLKIIEKIDLDVIRENESLKKVIIEFYIKNVLLVKDDYLFEALFYLKNSKIWEYSFKFLISQLNRFEECKSLQNYLNEFGTPYNELINISAKTISIDNDEDNRKLVEFLEKKECISSKKENKDKIIIRRKRK